MRVPAGGLLGVLASQEGGLHDLPTLRHIPRSITDGAQKQRTAKLQEAYRKKEIASPAEGMKTAKEIRSLGLLDVPVEEKHLNTYGGWLKPKDPKDR
jgi:hypothetical protein